MTLSTTVITLIVSFILTVILAPIVIPYLRRMKFGQSIREEGPQSHQVK
ncbi:MAG: phospho-N-acetylmuramoyl-pentapeptide-transferase, partial [Psychrobacillus psychrotolerans]